eukprot:166496-Rhodomonas_salina.2
MRGHVTELEEGGLQSCAKATSILQSYGSRYPTSFPTSYLSQVGDVGYSYPTSHSTSYPP